MNRSRHPAFAGPALAGEEHSGALARGEQFHLPAELTDQGRRAEGFEPSVRVVALT